MWEAVRGMSGSEGLMWEAVRGMSGSDVGGCDVRV